MVLGAVASVLSPIAFAAGILVIGLGITITWRAFQGYRRNDSQPMLLLAIGMLLITVIPTLVEIIIVPWFIARYITPGMGAVSLTLAISRVCEAVGISIIIYSLHTPART